LPFFFYLLASDKNILKKEGAEETVDYILSKSLYKTIRHTRNISLIIFTGKTTSLSSENTKKNYIFNTFYSPQINQLMEKLFVFYLKPLPGVPAAAAGAFYSSSSETSRFLPILCDCSSFSILLSLTVL